MKIFNCINLHNVLAFSALIRLILYLYSLWQDSYLDVKFTDIDYSVYSDAAQFVANNQSPYMRSTYRYTPLLSYLLLPNIYIFKGFGKIIFCLADLYCGFLLYKLARFRGFNENIASWIVAAFEFNPLTITLSVRGNADILVTTLISLCLLQLFNKKLISSAILLGIAIHFKIYPIIYGPAILLFLNKHYTGLQGQLNVNWLRIQYFLVSGLTFAVLFIVFWYIYGYEFVHETYLYHIFRRDTRHNFSVYFYYLYLASSSGTEPGILISLALFIPQVITLCYITYRFYRDLVFTVVIGTWIFVTFNKVITAQYFIWFLALLPLIIPASKMRIRSIIILFCVWFGTELHWLYWAYQLEFLGKSVFSQIWYAGAAFFSANCIFIACLIHNHRFTPVFHDGNPITLDFSKDKKQ